MNEQKKVTFSESYNPLIGSCNTDTMNNVRTVLEYLCFTERETKDYAVAPITRQFIAEVAFDAFDHVQKNL